MIIIEFFEDVKANPLAVDLGLTGSRGQRIKTQRKQQFCINLHCKKGLHRKVK